MQQPPSAAFTAPGPVFNLNGLRGHILTRKLSSVILRPLGEVSFRTIDLSGYVFRDEATQRAAHFLSLQAQRQCLHTVMLSNISGDLSPNETIRTLERIAASIGKYKQLRAVDLSHNAMGTIGVMYCAPLLKEQRSLRVVNLENTQLTTDSAKLLYDYLTEYGNLDVTQLRGLNLQNNLLQPDGLIYISKIISASPHLQCLRLSSVSICASGTCHLIKSLISTVMQLRELDLSNNEFDEICTHELSKVIGKQKKLQRLILSNLNLADHHIVEVLESLEMSKAPLMDLGLAGNKMKVLEEHRTKTITIRIYCMFFNSDTRLVILDLSNNNLDDNSIDILIRILKFCQRNMQYSLKKLNVARNNISQKVIIQLACELMRLRNFRSFDFSENFPNGLVSKSIGLAFSYANMSRDPRNDWDDSDVNGGAHENDLSEIDDELDNEELEFYQDRDTEMFRKHYDAKRNQTYAVLHALQTITKLQMIRRAEFDSIKEPYLRMLKLLEFLMCRDDKRTITDGKEKERQMGMEFITEMEKNVDQKTKLLSISSNSRSIFDDDDTCISLLSLTSTDFVWHQAGSLIQSDLSCGSSTCEIEEFSIEDEISTEKVTLISEGALSSRLGKFEDSINVLRTKVCGISDKLESQVSGEFLRPRKKQSSGALLFDCVRGLVMSLMVVVLVLCFALYLEQSEIQYVRL